MCYIFIGGAQCVDKRLVFIFANIKLLLLFWPHNGNNT